MMNIQGMDPSAHSASKCKLTSFIEEEISDSDTDSVPYISFFESWLKPHVSDAQISIPNYELVRQDRIKRKNGGVLLYVHSSLPISDIQKHDDDSCEAVICTIKSRNTKVASIYRPPDTSVQSFENLLTFLHNYLNPSDLNTHFEIVIMGDFNLPGISWECGSPRIETKEPSKSEALLLTFMEDNFLTQHITQPTRQRNTLDLFLTNNDNMVLCTTSDETNISDHNIVSIKTTYNIQTDTVLNRPPIPEQTFRSLNLQKADFDQINTHLENINWDDLKAICSPEEFPELLRLTILQVCMIYAPTKSQQPVKVNQFVRKRRSLRRRKRKVKAQLNAISNKNKKPQKQDDLRAELYDINLKIKESICTQKEEKEAKALQTIIENPRFFFSYAKQFSKRKSTVGPLQNDDGNLEHDPKTMADMLQKQYSSVFSDPQSEKKKAPNLNPVFHSTISEINITPKEVVKAIDEISADSACGENDIPALILKKCKQNLSQPIMILWKESFETGYIAKQYKTQVITPVHKKSSKADPANYRPIALTSHIIKTFERIVRNQLVAHLEKNHLLCKNQHGFRKHRSCLTQLLKHIDTVLKNLLNNQATDVIYLDYAKAFDKVDHQILLKKLHSYGIRGKLLTWLNAYLSNRWQTVVINGSHSYPAKVISGVPQGTVLGPILFIIYLNDLQSCIKHSVISSFADDTRLKRAINTTEDTVLLQSDLNSSIKWSDENNMQLHQKKFELITHTTDNSNHLQELPFSNEYTEYQTADGSVISPQNSVKDLGITITSDVSWHTHITNITEDAKKMSSWVLSVFSDRSAETMLPLYRSQIRSKVEYCSPLWNPAKVEDIKLIESIQRAFTSRIKEVKHMSYWDRLKSLNLMSLQRRRERYCVIQIYKTLHNLAPNDLELEFYQTTRRGLCCKVPPIVKQSKLKAQTMYDDSFRVTGAKLWNLIPNAIRQKTSLDSFKAALTKFLLQLQDNPPVPGISSANSLLTILASGVSAHGAVEDDGVRDLHIGMA